NDLLAQIVPTGDQEAVIVRCCTGGRKPRERRPNYSRPDQVQMQGPALLPFDPSVQYHWQNYCLNPLQGQTTRTHAAFLEPEHNGRLRISLFEAGLIPFSEVFQIDNPTSGMYIHFVVCFQGENPHRR
ncbi:hypothetical protein CLAIMM_13140, partial [Cladophialophora immunda]